MIQTPFNVNVTEHPLIQKEAIVYDPSNNTIYTSCYYKLIFQLNGALPNSSIIKSADMCFEVARQRTYEFIDELCKTRF